MSKDNRVTENCQGSRSCIQFVQYSWRDSNPHLMRSKRITSASWVTRAYYGGVTHRLQVEYFELPEENPQHSYLVLDSYCVPLTRNNPNLTKVLTMQCQYNL